jgi:hypothetical protein
VSLTQSENGNALALMEALERSGALSPTGLRLTPEITYDQFEALGALLGHMHQSLRFAIGDWLMQGEELFPERVYQAAGALGLSEEGMQEYLRVSRQVSRSTRRKTLSWSHHRAVASLEPPKQKEWLSRAMSEGLSHHDLRAALRASGLQPAEPARCRCCGRSFE